MSDDDRDPTDELLARARSVLDRRRATIRLLEERHQSRQEARDAQGEGEATGEEPSSPSDAFRDRLRGRLASRTIRLDDDGAGIPPRPPGGDAA